MADSYSLTLPEWLTLAQAAEWLTERTNVAGVRWTADTLLETLCTGIGPLADIHESLPVWLHPPSLNFQVVTSAERHTENAHIPLPVTHATVRLFYLHPTIDSSMVGVRSEDGANARLSSGIAISRDWLVVRGFDLLMFLRAYADVQKAVPARLHAPAPDAKADELLAVPEPAPDTAPASASVNESAPASAARMVVTNHTKRIHPPSADIAEARQRAADADDPSSVYGELQKLAEQRFGSLIGHSSDGVQYRGKHYEDTGEPDVLTKKNLTDRMRRAKAR